MQEKSSLNFAARLAHALKHSGVKASHLASKAGVSKGYVSELLKGNKQSPSIETCRKFAEVLDVSMVWLFDGDCYGRAKQADDGASLAADLALFPDVSREEILEAREEIARQFAPLQKMIQQQIEPLHAAFAPIREHRAEIAAMKERLGNIETLLERLLEKKTSPETSPKARGEAG